MKKKLSILISLITVFAVLLTGCGGGGGGSTNVSDQEAIAESQSTLDTFYSSIENNDTEKLRSILSNDGITINDGTESMTYTKDEFVSQLSQDTSSSYLGLVNEMNQTADVNGDTVTITGESFLGFQSSGITSQSNTTKSNIATYSSLGGTILEELSISNNNVTSLSSYSGSKFSIEYPDSWESASAAETSREALIALSPKLKLLIAAWSQDEFLDTDLTTVVNNTINNLETSNLITLESTTTTDSTINSSPAKIVTANYSKEYTPLIVEYKFKRKDGNYYLVEISLYKSDSTQTVSVQEKVYVINHNDDLYVASYSGKSEYYDLNEGNNILNSLTFK